MSQKGRKIGEGLNLLIQQLKQTDHGGAQILSGQCLSVDLVSMTMEALITLNADNDTETLTVNLNAVSGNGNGVIIFPAVFSHVVIGCVDGPGEYTLIRASDINKAIVTIGAQVLTMDGTKYGLASGTESMGKIMGDLMDKMVAMTFTNGAGTTSPANNVTDLTAIKTRLNGFLIS